MKKQRFKKGDKVIYTDLKMAPFGTSAKTGATAIVEGYKKSDGINWLRIKWDRKNKKCYQQKDGSYYEKKFSLYKKMKKQIKLACTSLGCPERFSVCCEAGSEPYTADEGTAFFMCSKCRHEFIGGECDAYMGRGRIGGDEKNLTRYAR